MNNSECGQIVLGRRKFVLAALISPFLIELTLTSDWQVPGKLRLDKSEEGFVILDGWVLLEADVIEQRG